MTYRDSTHLIKIMALGKGILFKTAIWIEKTSLDPSWAGIQLIKVHDLFGPSLNATLNKSRNIGMQAAKSVDVPLTVVCIMLL